MRSVILEAQAIAGYERAVWKTAHRVANRVRHPLTAGTRSLFGRIRHRLRALILRIILASVK